MRSKKGRWRLFDWETIRGPEGVAYLFRLRIVETPFCRVFLHRIYRSDWDRALHDHPWSFMSIILQGGYTEHTPKDVICFKPGSFIIHRGEDLHRLEIKEGKTATTLVLTGPKYRNWGFMTKNGWVHNEKYDEIP